MEKYFKLFISNKKNFFKHYIGTTKHKWIVFKETFKFAKSLLWRGVIHDNSKYSYVEAKGFITIIHKLKKSEYGSKEYYDNLAKIKPIIDMHYEENSHHPEHYPEHYIPQFESMDLLDITEMIIDWVAAVKRHENGDINKSININTKRYNIDSQLVSILQNSVNN